MRNLLFGLTIWVATLAPGLGLGLLPVAALAQPPSTQQALAERTMGRADAPVTLIEYSSLTCPHCADFHKDVLGQIKAAYVDTGKVYYVMRDFPLEPRAMAAAMVARCVDPARYFGFLDMLFKDQQAWAKSQDLLADLRLRAEFAGLSAADFNACLDDRALMQGIQKRAEEGRVQYGIEATPTFIVNGNKVSGARGFEQFKSAIDAQLAKKAG
jgi:protein-disulfide isomerase